MPLNKNVAVKCTYNNGGEGDFVGFDGTCSEEIIKLNVKNHVWCGNKDCECAKYVKRGFKGKKPEYPCMESELFNEWQFGSGWWHNGRYAGTPKRASLQKGGIAVLTTVFPNEKEKDRRIIGLYKIDQVTNRKDEETKFYADKYLKMRLPFDEAQELYLWDYYIVNGNKPNWGTGLLRYLSDEQVKKILEDLIQTVKSPNHRAIIGTLLEEYKTINTEFVKGLRKRNAQRKDIILGKRKYGPGGEGEGHKALKYWIKDNPNSIGLNNVTNCEVEYSFCSGDTVNLLFQVGDSKDVVVEIETDIPLPGSHQAIKYRALRCAERSLQLNDDRVKAILVAFEIPTEVQVFCQKYDIEFYKINKNCITKRST